MWHASVSIQRPVGRIRDEPEQAERMAINALEGVGGDREWWYWSPKLIGHLRVALTEQETATLPRWDGPIHDAGESGPERPRSA